MIATDFFAAQDRARANSKKLVILFMLAVFAIVISVSATFFFAYHGDLLAIPASAPNRDALIAEAFVESAPVFAFITLFTLAVVGIASGVKWLQIRGGGGAAIAEMLGGSRIDPLTSDPFERRLVNIVEEMAIASGVPLPAIYVLDQEEGINAFAAGLTTSDAAVAVTAGAIEQLSRDELQAVIAHEFGHILNGDMRLNARLIAMLAGIFVLIVLGRIAVRVAMHSGAQRRRNDRDMTPLFFLGVGLILIVLGAVGFFFGRLIQAAISRQREFLADASAVQFTRNPLGLTGAFKKIGGLAQGSRIDNPHASELSHTYFAQGFRENFITRLFATHPPLIERIRAFEPNFTGEYEPPLSREEALDELRREESAPQKPRQRPLGMPIPMGSPVGAGPMGEPAAMIAQIGVLDAATHERAHALHQSLPERLHHAAHDSEEVTALVYALLLDRESEPIRARQLQLLAGAIAQDEISLVNELGRLTLELDARLRLPLAQIAFPQLRQRLEEGGLDAFLANIHALAEVDGKLDVFEFALTRLFAHHLKTADQPLSARERYRSLGGLQDELSLLFSLTASLAESEEEIPRVFEAGVARLELQGVRLLPVSALRFEALDLALETLALTSFNLRRTILEALAVTIAGDGAFTIDEADLLRAVASIFECPMPPIDLSERAEDGRVEAKG